MSFSLHGIRRFPRLALSLAVLPSISLAGCSMMSSSGPSAGRVNGVAGAAVADANIQIVDMTDQVARQVIAANQAATFLEALGDDRQDVSLVGPGDILDIQIWEAPPAALFGMVGGTGDASQTIPIQIARNTNLPEQMVSASGHVVVPFAGSIRAAGRTPEQIGAEIVARLNGIAHRPQVVVRLTRNATRTVTVVGDVANSSRVPLTAKGETLLDALAAAGGVKQPVNKTIVQITRGTSVVAQPLETVIADPRQNIHLRPDDVVTAFFQRYSFTALGATGSNAEIAFEGTGITLSQALGRVGGLNDQRSNPSGVFIFRLEKANAVDPALTALAQRTPDGKIPVIYRINLRDPRTFFIAQSFPMMNRDVLYVSNAPIADLQKFVNIISAVVIPAITVQNATTN